MNFYLAYCVHTICTFCISIQIQKGEIWGGGGKKDMWLKKSPSPIGNQLQLSEIKCMNSTKHTNLTTNITQIGLLHTDTRNFLEVALSSGPPQQILCLSVNRFSRELEEVLICLCYINNKYRICDGFLKTKHTSTTLLNYFGVLLG